MTEGNKTATPQRQGILSLAIKDKSALYASYMPFVKHGGLFIPSSKPYKIGDEVFMLLTLMQETEKLPVAGRVVWITPKGAQGNRIPVLVCNLAVIKKAKPRAKKLKPIWPGRSTRTVLLTLCNTPL